MDLDKSPVDSLKGVGPSLSEKLAKMSIHTLQDVLFHLPSRYEDRTRITPIGALKPGDTVVIEGEVLACDVTFGRRRSLLAILEDKTGRIGLRFFHFNKTQQKGLSPGSPLRCFGEVRRGASGLEIYHPEYSRAQESDLPDRLTPVYPSTEGLSQNRYRQLVARVMDLMDHGEVLKELPVLENSISRLNINDALRLVHTPPPEIDLAALMDGRHPAQQKLAFEEMLAHQIILRISREEINLLTAPGFSPPAALHRKLQASLGFTLTNAQSRVAVEVANDLARRSPALRLVQGDVGSGKTVIAALSAVHAVENGLQVAIMAPTEILAEQHLLNLSNWLIPLDINVAWLTGKIKGKKRSSTLETMASGEAQVIVGTHALFQSDVHFHNLGLVIIDEQHRFGVHQRMALREKGGSDTAMPHQLVMTATPIPRTLTMSLYADMDCSVIDELPPGRSPVTTVVLPDNRREEVISRVDSACRTGAQAYWVCTLIEESEALQCEAAEVTATRLAEELSGLNIGLIHGRLSSQEKTERMAEFKQGKIDLLVATTVIEVGVDVPNASLMVIENSERLGLAQLHQLRGRIGRGEKKSHCVLLYHPPLGETGKKRLNVMRESDDGFFIAEQDLRIRGPGELFGAKQSGSLQFKIADLIRDHHMLGAVAEASKRLLVKDQTTARAIVARWITSPEEFSQV